MDFAAECNCPIELIFTSTLRYTNPYTDAGFDVVFTREGGTSMVVPGFWAGGDTWKARFAPPEPGTYRYRTVSANPGDNGLHDQRGQIAVAPYRGANPLLLHGRLRVAADRRHFEFGDGTPFFWLGDTWYMALCSRLAWPGGFQRLAADRAAKGFNVIHLVAGLYPDMDAWDPRGRNEAGHPFVGDFDRLNPAYFDCADIKIGHLVESGLVPCITAMWGYYLAELGVERVKRFWRFLVARYGAYPVVWCMCGEATMTNYLAPVSDHERLRALQKHGWTEVMRYVRELDPYRNLITIHPTRFGRTQVEDPLLMDFETLQTGHSDFETVLHNEEMVAISVPKEPKMPVIVGEVNYEGILGRAWQNVQRLCFYKAVLSGTAGHSYGANGIWQLNEAGKPYGASPHGRSWGNMPWTEAMHLPGSTQMGHAKRFIERFEWWRLEQHPEWLDPPQGKAGPYEYNSVGIPNELRIVYVPLLWDAPILTRFELGPSYTAYYFDPRTGEDIPLGPVVLDDSGRWRPPLPPEVSDWLLTLVAK